MSSERKREAKAVLVIKFRSSFKYWEFEPPFFHVESKQNSICSVNESGGSDPITWGMKLSLRFNLQQSLCDKLKDDALRGAALRYIGGLNRKTSRESRVLQNLTIAPYTGGSARMYTAVPYARKSLAKLDSRERVLRRELYQHVNVHLYPLQMSFFLDQDPTQVVNGAHDIHQLMGLMLNEVDCLLHRAQAWIKDTDNYFSLPGQGSLVASRELTREWVLLQEKFQQWCRLIGSGSLGGCRKRILKRPR